jgi:FixJ family two-component response regulator
MSDKRRLIAIVDDDEGVCRALKRLVVALEMDAATFGSGQAFLDSLPMLAADCVLLDLHMPGLTGEDVLRALTKAGSDLPVIVITGQDDPANRDLSMALGANAYLAKPLVPSELRLALDNALSRTSLPHWLA